MRTTLNIDDDLLQKAAKLTGIEEKTSLVLSPAIWNWTKAGGLKVLSAPCIFFPKIPHNVFFYLAFIP